MKWNHDTKPPPFGNVLLWAMTHPRFGYSPRTGWWTGDVWWVEPGGLGEVMCWAKIKEPKQIPNALHPPQQTPDLAQQDQGKAE